MRRRSSGSSEQSDQSPVEAPHVPPAQPDKSQWSPLPGQTPKKLDPRPDPASRPSSTRSRRSGNFNWKPSQTRNGLVEKPALGSSAHSLSASPLDTGDSDAIDELQDLDEMEKTADSNPTGRRPRSRNPWSIRVLTLVTSCVGIGFLILIINSLVTRQLDPKGCRMSYMRPSYAKLNDFDTEHTRFASKYSLYLYREQGVDEDTKVSRSAYLARTYRRQVTNTSSLQRFEEYRFSSSQEMQEATSRFDQLRPRRPITSTMSSDKMRRLSGQAYAAWTSLPSTLMRISPHSTGRLSWTKPST
jgi:hypothetical protein